jgi:transposase
MDILSPPEVKEKRPPGRRPKYSASYMQMVGMKVVEEGMSYREAGKTFNLSHGSISNIVKNYKNGNLKRKRKETTSKYQKEVEDYRNKARMNDLKLEIADLYLENLMLKKMLEHSLQKKKESSSDITSEDLDPSPERAK